VSGRLNRDGSVTPALLRGIVYHDLQAIASCRRHLSAGPMLDDGRVLMTCRGRRCTRRGEVVAVVRPEAP
jgi:hypothetical protein